MVLVLESDWEQDADNVSDSDFDVEELIVDDALGGFEKMVKNLGVTGWFALEKEKL